MADILIFSGIVRVDRGRIYRKQYEYIFIINVLTDFDFTVVSVITCIIINNKTVDYFN